jgi:hypothetical protein
MSLDLPRDQRNGPDLAAFEVRDRLGGLLMGDPDGGIRVGNPLS